MDGCIFENAGVLKDEFWRAFAHNAGQISDWQMKSIQIARKSGYFFRYGTFYSGGQNGVVGVESMSIERRRVYLEALL